MGRRGRKKKWKVKRPVSHEEIYRKLDQVPAFAIRQFRSSRYWLDTRGLVYAKKGGKRYKPVDLYFYRGYVCFDMFIERRGKTVKKRKMVHRCMLECYYTDNDYLDRSVLTVHHITGNKYDNSVCNLYACQRCKHDIIENEQLEVISNFDFGQEIASVT